MTISRSRPKPDILIRDDQGYPVAVVEVKNMQDLNRDEATELRHNLIDYGIPSRVPYFLILSQDVGFLWKEQASPAEAILSRDKEAFSIDRRIRSELASYNCRYIGSFRDALNFIQRFA